MEMLGEINGKLDRLLLHQESKSDVDDGIFDVLDAMTLLELPPHLRTTAMTLFEIGEGSADDLAVRTGKERAVESNYLNQLVRMGHVSKSRVGRKVYFSINESSGQ